MNTTGHANRAAKAARHLPEEAFLAIARTEAVLHDGLDRVLAPHGLSLTQYNVLRMLRGAGVDGLCRNEIRDRLITRMPDVSRLLDRMEAVDLVHRVRSTADRRLVNTTLTDRGSALVNALDGDVMAFHTRQLGHLSDQQLETLVQLLEQVRTRS